MPDKLDQEIALYTDADGKVSYFDGDLIEAERRKPPPKTEEEAAQRYRLMQAAQIIRLANRTN